MLTIFRVKEGRLPTHQRQAELTDAALRIIASKGISQLTTRALAEEVGLTTGAIFRHFATLEALLDAVALRVEAVLDSTYPPAELDARERLERFVQARSETVGSQLGIMRLVHSEQFVIALPKESSKRLAMCVRKSRQFVLKCIEEGQKSGAFRDDVDALSLVVIVTGTIQRLALSTSSAELSREQAIRAREVLLRLIQPPKSKRSSKRKTLK